MKSKGVAYLLLIFLGWCGAHRFYLGKYLSGFIYLCTCGFLGVGLFIDLFTLSGKVDIYNAMYMSMYGRGGNNTNTNTNNISININKGEVE